MDFVSRETWGALTLRSLLLPLIDADIEGVVVHHTTGGSNDPQQKIRAHDRYHRHTRGWGGGLAYCWLVSSDGRIWEGRGWNRGGATGRKWDSRTVSVAFIGDAGDELPAAAAAALGHVIESTKNRYGKDLWVKPHSDFKATSCPGDLLRQWCATFDPKAPTGAPDGSDGNVRAPGFSLDWGALAALFAGLRAEVERKPLRRWRRNHKPAVTAIQARLEGRGYSVGPIDGIYGRKTAAAVESFQRHQGFLRPNGRVGVSTWDAAFIQ